MQLVVLGLGSNKSFQGKSPLQNLVSAYQDLSLILQNSLFSSVYRTKAMYVEDQEDFYNMVVIGFVADELKPQKFLQIINSIEAKNGRDRSKEIRFGPRSLDIDIELFGNYLVNTTKLQIPHIRIKERAFVLIPLLEIFPQSADENIRKEYLESLRQLEEKNETNDVKLYLSREDFSKLL